MSKIHPYHDWILVRIIKADSHVVTTADAEDTQQRGEVLAVGPGVWYQGEFVTPKVKIGGKVLFLKHKFNADTPNDLLNDGLALIRDIHLMAVEE